MPRVQKVENIRLPLMLAGALALQGAGVVWWASAVASRVDAAESKIEKFEDARIGERVARIEQLALDIQHTVNRLADKQR